MILMANARKTAVKALLKIEQDSAYSNITLNSVFKESEFSSADKALISALVYGVLDRKITLDYVLSRFMKTPVKKTAPFTLMVLRTALYQIMYMDKIPQSAAVNEAVKLIKTSKENRNSGFVNAVLRAVLRAEKLLPEGDSINELSIRFSCPELIVKSFFEDYGKENTKKLLESSLETPPLTVRVNTAKTDAESLKQSFLDDGIACESADIDNCLYFPKGFDVQNNESYKKGYFYVQDTASQKAVSVLSPQKNTRVLDMCAAPGGKSFTMANLMENKGELIACDLYEARVKLIADSAKRLGLDIIHPAVCDATEYNENLGLFDCILCDVPCSGLGVLRRKPEIKYKEDFDFTTLEDIQYRILCNAVKYLKKGGKILYSTCTLRIRENENLVNRFLTEYNGFRKIYEHTFMPHTDNTDGFYCALLVNDS